LLPARTRREPTSSPSRVAEAYPTRPCNSALPSYACFVTPSLSGSSSRTTRWVGAITCHTYVENVNLNHLLPSPKIYSSSDTCSSSSPGELSLGSMCLGEVCVSGHPRERQRRNKGSISLHLLLEGSPLLRAGWLNRAKSVIRQTILSPAS
jgi:hypothetical protein